MIEKQSKDYCCDILESREWTIEKWRISQKVPSLELDISLQLDPANLNSVISNFPLFQTQNQYIPLDFALHVSHLLSAISNSRYSNCFSSPPGGSKLRGLTGISEIKARQISNYTAVPRLCSRQGYRLIRALKFKNSLWSPTLLL